ncbi:hypothetical protein ACFQZI_20530 [Mucilaginibacter lutimaris]|uniref:Copper resistance protein NlpE n=1 Tax=Mucilaginibacter lutimaris TaxID=931629 RepID=A0ABW2ZM09_9SPHI
MNKLTLYFMLPAIILLSVSCQNNKPQPTSTDGKTAVTVNGKKDSVLNNPAKNYGNATVAEPCVKCVIKIVQATAHYKMIVANKDAGKISYVVNWDSSDRSTGSTHAKDTTINSLKIDVIENNAEKNKLATFKYDNNLTKLQFVSDDAVIDEKISDSDLKLIRNKCFWGVASNK